MTNVLTEQAREWLRRVNGAAALRLPLSKAPDNSELFLDDVVVRHRWNGETIDSIVADASREPGPSERLPAADPQLVLPASYAEVLVNAIGRIRKIIRSRS